MKGRWNIGKSIKDRTIKTNSVLNRMSISRQPLFLAIPKVQKEPLNRYCNTSYQTIFNFKL